MSQDSPDNTQKPPSEISYGNTSGEYHMMTSEWVFPWKGQLLHFRRFYGVDSGVQILKMTSDTGTDTVRKDQWGDEKPWSILAVTKFLIHIIDKDAYFPPRSS